MKFKLTAAVLMLLVTATTSYAVPIVYNGQLEPGVTVTGTIDQPRSEEDNPVGAQYYSFFANVGDPIDITGTRLDGAFDMSFWIFEGLFTDTDDFLGGSSGGFDTNDPGFVDFADDEINPPILPGPFGDPQSVFNAPSTGFYTLAVTNFLSDSNTNPPYDFQLLANGIQAVPEPTSMALWGIVGLGAVGFARRRRKARS